MQKDGFWKLFETTGKIDAYLCYKNTETLENNNEFENKGFDNTRGAVQGERQAINDFNL